MRKKLQQIITKNFKNKKKKPNNIELLDFEEEVEVLNTKEESKILKIFRRPLKKLSHKNKLIADKELILIIIISLFIIATMLTIKIFIVLNQKITKEEEFLNNIYNQDQLIRIKKNDKYGYIDSKGKIKIKIKYDEASNFIGKYALVKEDKKYKIINEQGQTKLKSNNKIEYVDSIQYWIVDYKLYNTKLEQISNDNLKVKSTNKSYLIWSDLNSEEIGIMNSKGEKTYSYKLEDKESYINVQSIEDETSKENYCIINIDNKKYAILNCETGEEIYEYQENKIVLKENNIYEVISQKSNEVIESIYINKNKIVYSAKSNESLKYYGTYIQIRDASKPYNERYSYLIVKNDKITTTRPETNKINTWEELTNYKKISCQNQTLYGLTYKEKEILECNWQDIQYFNINLYKYLKYQNKNYILGKKDDKWQIINLNNEKVIKKFNTTSIVTNENSTFIYYKDKKTSERTIYNLLTKKTLSVKEDQNSINLYQNYITVKDKENKELRYYNNNLKLIYTEKL